jgi:signal transduction histidine kinase
VLPSIILVGGLFLAALAALALIAARRAGALDARRQAAAEHERLAGEQMALRRVATLVAQGPPPAAVFDAVAAEMEGLLNADGVMLSRYQPDSEVSMVAHRGSGARLVPPGTRARHEPESVSAIVRRTRCPARMDNYTGTHGAIGELVQSLGVRAAVGAPVAVDGRLWGVIIATWTGEQVPPADTEQRMARFAQLLETAIANADARDQLTASRARLLTAGDEVGRRLVRDLHDGAQQRLMHTIVTLKLAQRALRNGDGDVAPLVDEALEQAQRGTAELRELAHGILPTRLTRGGLREAVDAAAEGLAVRVQVDVPDDRFGSEVEANAYFIIVEALTNVVRHARAEHAEVRVCVHDRTLRIEVRDDGIGGADPHGRGLVGVGDRATALGGRLDIASPNGGGTLVTARLPLTRGDQGAAPAPP